VATVTRAQQRAGTRQAILDATVALLIDEGYAALSTRRVAERAGIAQSTLMHHFPAREAFLVDAVTHLAERLNAEAVAQLADLPSAAAVIDAGWQAFTSPAAVAAAQLWAAAWAEPELAAALREAEERLAVIIIESAGAQFPHAVGRPEALAMLDAAVTLIRGFVMQIPVAGREEVEARWQAVRPLVVESAERLLDRPPPTP
jgi:AcrR family transcriptional regulator